MNEDLLKYLDSTEDNWLNIKQQKFKIVSLKGGKNNRVYKVKGDNVTYLLKSYFQNKNDLRNRLFTEYTFLEYVWHQGIKVVPRPLCKDEKKNIALYEFIEGRKLRPTEVNQSHLTACLDFFFSLNQNNKSAEAKKISNASEAFFSITDHINCVDRRINSLREIEEIDNSSYAAKSFINNDLFVSWEQIKSESKNKASSIGLNIEEEISQEERVLSPSDFGFHNAIMHSNNKLAFIDFEYAGWDDPSKMVCDYFCQPEIPIPHKFFSFFVNQIMSKLPYPNNFFLRTNVLYPIYKIKWCCIMLNEFLPTGKKRRLFAKEKDFDNEKYEQLKKIYKYYENFIKHSTLS